MMQTEDKVVSIARLMAETANAKILCSMLHEGAYTASELAGISELSSDSAIHHLNDLMAAGLIKEEMRGRHFYYVFAKPEVAYVIETIAGLEITQAINSTQYKEERKEGPGYCSTCYDHLAGYVAVQITEALELNALIKQTGGLYTVTVKGWQWLAELGICRSSFTEQHRPIAYQCMDWSEQRPHIAGQLAAALFDAMKSRKWIEKGRAPREILVTPKGRKEIYKLLGIDL